MKRIILEEKYILRYIKEVLNTLKMEPVIIESARYHHNSSYINAFSRIENGVLSLSELHRLNIIKRSNKFLEIMNDIESHVNGIDGISLAVVGLTDLYRDEEEYNPLNCNLVDFLISSDIKASRRSTHYGNEFIANKCISNKHIKSVDIRILKYLSKVDNIVMLEELIKKYNCLIRISNSLKKANLDIPIREMSDESNISLNVDKLIEMPRLVLKK